MIAIWVQASLAADCQLDAKGFEELVSRANDALDRDDPVGHGATWREMQERLPCLREPLPASSWASFLVGLALLERTVGLPNWSQPLQVATEVDPKVPRDVGDDAFRKFAPVAIPAPGPALPTDAGYFLDGRALEREPTVTGGPHVVQRQKGATWTTLLLRDAPFPADWKAAVVVAEVPEPAGETELVGVLWAVGGAGAATQQTDAAARFVPSTEGAGAMVGVATHGGIQPGLAGAFWDGGLAVHLQAPLDLHANAGIALGGATVAVQVGAGLGTARIEQTDGGQGVVLVRPHVGVSGGLPLGDWSLDGAVGGGWIPASSAASGWAALSRGGGPVGPVFGLDGGFASYHFDEEGGSHVLDVTQWWAGATVGVGLRGGR